MTKVKIIDSTILDTNKIKDLADSLKIVESKSLELIPILGILTRRSIPGNVLPPDEMKYKTEGGVSVLENEFARLQAALRDAQRRIKPALQTLKGSLR